MGKYTRSSLIYTSSVPLPSIPTFESSFFAINADPRVQALKYFHISLSLNSSLSCFREDTIRI